MYCHPLDVETATPVGAVSNTITSSGSTCPESSNNFIVSLSDPVYERDDIFSSFPLHQGH